MGLGEKGSSGILSIIIAAILMGSVAIFVRNLHMNPIHITFFRFLFGFLFLLPITMSTKRWPSFDDPKLLLSISIINVAIVTFYISAIQLIPVGLAALLLYMAPVYVIPIAYLTGEKVNPGVFISLPISIAGLFLMLMPSGSFNIGIGFGFIAGLSYAFYFFVIKRLREWMPSLEITTIYLGISSIILSPSLLILPISGFDPLWLIGLGLIPTAIAFTLFNFGLKYCRISEGPLLALTEPVAASIFGFIIFGETFTPIQILGITLVLLGVGIALKNLI
ncbi:MAG: EamA family transporter [Archaeoglobus sp.]|nr:EamA family transporter [Archaeoglobus sp.]